MTLRSAATALAALGALAVLAGCEGSKNLVDLQGGWPAFQKYVLAADKPVLVDFYKDQCPTCVWQEKDLDPLTEEYRGRVYFYKFKIEDRFMRVICKEVVDKYKVYLVPTVILFVNGQPKERWVFNHFANDFRKPLDAVAGPPPASGPGAPAPDSGGPPPAPPPGT